MHALFDTVKRSRVMNLWSAIKCARISFSNQDCVYQMSRLESIPIKIRRMKERRALDVDKSFELKTQARSFVCSLLFAPRFVPCQILDSAILCICIL